jgi:hypothetical protein
MYIFSYLFTVYKNRLKVENLEAMAKLHAHYITNAKKELKYAYAGVSDNDFQSSVQEVLSNPKVRDDFYEEEEEEDGDNSIDCNQNDAEIEKWININDPELRELLDIEVNVVIEPRPLPTIDHGSSEFDMEAAVDKVLGIT